MRIYLLYFFIVILVIGSCKAGHPSLAEIKQVDGFPSGSGMAWINNRLCIAGDDAGWLLMLDSNFNSVDSIQLFNSPYKRIPKEDKADIESIATVQLDARPALLLTGSGSVSPNRNTCLVVDPVTKEKKQFQLDTFYSRLRGAGLKDLNIEGATALPGSLLLSGRGNKSFPYNYLALVSDRFWENQATASIKLIKLGRQTDTALFAGVSGMDYSALTDQLLVTVSTENTYNSYDDGSIGKSYLWIIDDLSTKIASGTLLPDSILDLEEMDTRFRGMKIESVCIMKEDKTKKELILVSDDDKGGTVLFRVIR